MERDASPIMNNKNSGKSDNWYVPLVHATQLGWLLVVFFVLFAITGISWLTAFSLFRLGLGLGGIGAALLLIARIPAYRLGHFFNFGPGSCPGIYRKIYFAAYVFIVPSIALLISTILCLRK
jgi:hypothetical protein